MVDLAEKLDHVHDEEKGINHVALVRKLQKRDLHKIRYPVQTRENERGETSLPQQGRALPTRQFRHLPSLLASSSGKQKTRWKESPGQAGKGRGNRLCLRIRNQHQLPDPWIENVEHHRYEQQTTGVRERASGHSLLSKGHRDHRSRGASSLTLVLQDRMIPSAFPPPAMFQTSSGFLF